MRIRGGLIWFCKIAGLIVGFSIIGYLLITISYTLPRHRVRSHIAESVKHYGNNTEWAYGIKAARDDIFTDAIMLHSAGFPSQDHFRSAAYVPRDSYEEIPPQEALNVVYGGQTTDAEPAERHYPRYWHGYLVFLTPLLEFFNPAEITYLNFALQFGLIVAVLLLAYRRRGAKLTIALAAFFFALNPISTALSYQFSTVFYPTILAMLAILIFDSRLRKKGRYCLFFTFIGCVTNFFDLLTFPLVSLGVPLALKLYLDNEQCSDLKTFLKGNFRQLVQYSLCWLLGYACTWGLKWTIASIVTGQNIFHDALDRVVFRSSGGSFNSFDAIRVNVETLCNLPTIAVFGILAVIYLVLLWRRKIQIKKPNIASCIFIILALFPFVWYAALTNHSFLHTWFTYRELTIAVFAVALFIASITKRRVVKITRISSQKSSNKKTKK